MSLRKKIKRFLFPTYCLLCREETEFRLCTSCQPLLERRIEFERGEHSPSWQEPFDACISVFEKSAAIQTLVCQFRRSERYLAKELAAWMTVALLEKELQVDEVTFVPSPPLRTFFRGYVPAKLLAAEVARGLSLPLKSYLKRVGGEPSQEKLSPLERGRSRLETLSLKATPKGKRLLLIDDYTQTGATLHFAGLLLRMEEPKALFAVTLFQDTD